MSGHELEVFFTGFVVGIVALYITLYLGFRSKR